MSLTIYNPTLTRSTHPPPHLDLVDTEDADSLAQILFPPLTPHKQTLNALLGHVGAVKGTIAFAESFETSSSRFHHVTTARKRTTVYRPRGTETCLVLVRPVGEQRGVERELGAAWEGFLLRFGGGRGDDAERSENKLSSERSEQKLSFERSEHQVRAPREESTSAARSKSPPSEARSKSEHSEKKASSEHSENHIRATREESTSAARRECLPSAARSKSEHREKAPSEHSENTEQSDSPEHSEKNTSSEQSEHHSRPEREASRSKGEETRVQRETTSAPRNPAPSENPWDLPGASDYWAELDFTETGLRRWIADGETDIDVSPASEGIARRMETLQNAITNLTHSTCTATYTVTPPLIHTHGTAPSSALTNHLLHLHPAKRDRRRSPSPSAPTPAHAPKWTTLGLGPGPIKSSSGGRWPSLSIPGLSRSADASPPPPAKPSSATGKTTSSNNLASWFGFSSTPPPPPTTIAPHDPPKIASMHLEDLDDALAEDIIALPRPFAWRVEDVWLPPSPRIEVNDSDPVDSTTDGAEGSRRLKRHALAYTVIGETLLAALLATSTSAQSLSEQLNASDAPHDEALHELHASVRELAHYLAHPPRLESHSKPFTGSTAVPELTNHIHLTRSSHATHVSSSWNGEHILNPTDAKAGKPRKRETSVDQAGGWAKGSLMIIDHARELFARTTNDIWIAGRLTRGRKGGDAKEEEEEEEAYLVVSGKETRSIVDAECLLRQVMKRC